MTCNGKKTGATCKVTPYVAGSRCTVPSSAAEPFSLSMDSLCHQMGGSGGPGYRATFSNDPQYLMPRPLLRAYYKDASGNTPNCTGGHRAQAMLASGCQPTEDGKGSEKLWLCGKDEKEKEEEEEKEEEAMLGNDSWAILECQYGGNQTCGGRHVNCLASKWGAQGTCNTAPEKQFVFSFCGCGSQHRC